jgi:hypothetical protein
MGGRKARSGGRDGANRALTNCCRTSLAASQVKPTDWGVAGSAAGAWQMAIALQGLWSLAGDLPWSCAASACA